MAFFTALALMAGICAAALAWFAGSQNLGGIGALAPEAVALAGTMAFAAVFAAGAISVNRRINARLGQLRDEAHEFETAISRRLSETERRLDKIGGQASGPAAGTAARSHAPFRVMSALSAFPAGAQDSGAGKVVLLDPAARARAAEDKRRVPTQHELGEAIGGNKLDAWFQPIVALPSRKSCFLEGLPYLHGEGEERLGPDIWLKSAARAGLGGKVDRQMLLHCLRLARELRRTEKPVGVLWRFSRHMLSDLPVWSEVADILKANQAVNGSFLCEIDLRDYVSLGHEEMERLRLLREYGFKLSIWAGRDVSGLLGALRSGLFAQARGDVSNLLPGRYGEPPDFAALQEAGRKLAVELSATGVENEDEAIALIDRDIVLAQGGLFAPARPLRDAGAEAGSRSAD